MSLARRATAASTGALADAYDVALLDLDGVVYIGEQAVAHAPKALGSVRARGMRLAFVTNNASRTPETVAAHLTAIGVPATPGEVATSAQAGARMVSELVSAGAAVLVVGGAGLVAALEEHGLRPVFSAEDDPVAVIQGYDPDLCWRGLAEGAYVLHRDVPWVATNTDRTFPTSRGLAPGNGTFVDVLRLTTGREPVVAGKPEPPMHREAVLRSGARRPLVVGDRLDTDIEGANRVGADSLLVLTGVSRVAEIVQAPPGLRPTYLASDLRGLLSAHPTVDLDADGGGAGRARCGRWTAALVDGEISVYRAPASPARDDGDDALRALAAVAWSSDPDGTPKVGGIEAAWATVSRVRDHG